MLKILISIFRPFIKAKGRINLTKGPMANTIPISKGLYPLNASIFGKNIIYTPIMAK